MRTFRIVWTPWPDLKIYGKSRRLRMNLHLAFPSKFMHAFIIKFQTFPIRSERELSKKRIKVTIVRISYSNFTMFYISGTVVNPHLFYFICVRAKVGLGLPCYDSGFQIKGGHHIRTAFNGKLYSRIRNTVPLNLSHYIQPKTLQFRNRRQ